MSFKLKVDTNSINSSEQTIRQAFDKVISNSGLLQQIGNTVVEDVQFQTRSGRSIPGKGRLKPLSANWVKSRMQISKVTTAGQAYGDRRSNLTLSGQLLESMKANIKGKGQVSIDFEGFHQPYKKQLKEFFLRKQKKRINGRLARRIVAVSGQGGVSTVGKQIRNEDLAEYVAKQGRPFVGLRDQVRVRINRQVVEYIRRSSSVLRLTK